jgi:hypothetical protein
MARALQNPDRNFSANGEPEKDFQSLRHALDFDKPALPYNEAAKLRIGKLITDAVLPACIRPPARRVGTRRSGPP